ncbi:hypothetical protein COT72_04405 [archaeon CG10_big_fil_rev_8_21_14_0_10_43_11]|nr:MAG: hypothetical protein COT72_04405 [archaeon CG10_big_fil_rev_8_21_14_0_10_43_11]
MKKEALFLLTLFFISGCTTVLQGVESKPLTADNFSFNVPDDILEEVNSNGQAKVKIVTKNITTTQDLEEKILNELTTDDIEFVLPSTTSLTAVYAYLTSSGFHKLKNNQYIESIGREEVLTVNPPKETDSLIS